MTYYKEGNEGSSLSKEEGKDEEILDAAISHNSTLIALNEQQATEIERLNGLIEQLYYDGKVLEFLMENYHPSQADTKAIESWQQFAKENGLKESNK